MDKTVVYSASAAAVGIALLAVYTVLKLNHVDISDFLPFIIGIAALVPGTAAWRNSQEIKKQTNGPLSQTHETVSSMETRLAVVEVAIQEIKNAIQQQNSS